MQYSTQTVLTDSNFTERIDRHLNVVEIHTRLVR
jgi:hypothetical protein